MSKEKLPSSINAEEIEDSNSESTTETEQSSEVERDPRVESLAIPLARDYAEKNYKKREDGTFEPAWRGVNGEKQYKGKSPEQIAEEEGITVEEARSRVIDIANQPYNEYSEYWKDQNRGGAEFLIGLLDEKGAEAIAEADLSDNETREEYGNRIHDNWLKRNSWAKDPNYGDPVLAQSYNNLPANEQQKDIDQLAVLQTWLKGEQEKTHKRQLTYKKIASAAVNLNNVKL